MTKDNDKSMANMAMDRASHSPFVTITGPLGFGGLVLFWQLQDIHEQLEATSKQQVELSQQVTEMGAEVRQLSEANKARREDVDRVKVALDQLDSRVETLERAALERKP